MSTFIGVRALNRSQRIDLGGRTISPATGVAGSGAGVTGFVNLDNLRVRRDLARHTTLGAIVTGTGLPFALADDGTIVAGGQVTVRATGLVLDVTAVNFVTAAGVAGSGAAGTATVGTADGTNPRIDTIAVNTATGAFVVIAGIPTPGATLFNHRGASGIDSFAGTGNVTAVTAWPAARIPLAHVLVPAAATNLTQVANVLDIRA
jgi:hypothetical protein